MSEGVRRRRVGRLGWFGGPLVAAGLALLACGRGGPGPAAAAVPVEPSRCLGCNVVLVSIDTLRADHLGCYGYGRDTSPHIDAFARGAVLFERAASTSYHTADSHMSVFTSLYPSVHWVRNATGGNKAVHALDAGIETVTEVFHGGGYRTVGLHGGGNLSALYGFERGFDVYRKVSEIEPVVEWVRAEGAKGRFFLFFHTYRVHDPYLPPPPYDARYDPDYRGDVGANAAAVIGSLREGGFAAMRKSFWGAVDRRDPDDLRHLQALYDGGINQVDDELGRLLAALDEVAPRTVVALISDHGEEFLEHGRFLHDQLYGEVLHVPLILRNPAQPGGLRVPGRVSLIDLAPTLLDLVGLPPLPQAQGVTLLPRLSGGPEAERDVYAEKLVGPTLQAASRHLALIRGEEKLILRRGSSRPELYDLAADPDERHDLGRGSGEAGDLLRRARAWEGDNLALARRLHPAGAGTEAVLDGEAANQLRALGYLQ